MGQKTRSPLKERPLRYAGQSTDDAIQGLVSEIILKYFLVSFAAVLAAVLEWIRWFAPSRQIPIVTTILALIAVGYSAFRIVKARQQIESFKMGRDGEKAVAECLDNLRQRGYAIFHDIVGDGFNVDHAVLSPQGIFTIETKTRSKPIRGDARVVYDGDRILVGGRESDRAPITQALAESNWLHGLLKESTGKVYPVRPIVVFPGWFVEQTPSSRGSRVWVLNPKGIAAFIDNEPARIAQEDLHLAAYHLSRYIRTKT